MDLDAELQREARFSSQDERAFGLGRVLIWLMAPAAAESLKYGQNIRRVASF